MPGEAYLAVAETHTGAVVFKGERAYKFKKPVRFAFEDLSTVRARRRACEEEVSLNRRLAPDVYLGVGELTEPDGSPPEPVVIMRRLPADRRLSTLVTRGDAATADELERIAALLADFHAAAPRTAAAADAAGPTATLARWEANATELAAAAPAEGARAASDAVVAAAREYLAGRAALLRHRVSAGWACDGHGDLLADDIFCLPDAPRVLDCLEFDEHLRAGDVLADVAFLAMDLERLGEPDLGWSFLLTHRRLLGDDWPTSLAHHQIAYRAQVRAKVAALRAQQASSEDRQVTELLALAARHLEAGRVHLVVIGGPPGTGKSTLAQTVGTLLEAKVIRSDEVRKELAGLPTGTHATTQVDRGIYSDDWTAATYATLLERARDQLSCGSSVVLDASWSDPNWREYARRVASTTTAALSELRCCAPPAVVAERVARRVAAGDDLSDADEALSAQLAARFPSWPEAIDIETSGEPHETAASAGAVIRRPLAAF